MQDVRPSERVSTIWCCRRRGAGSLLQDPAEQDPYALGSVMRGFDQHQLACRPPGTPSVYQRLTNKFYRWCQRQYRRWRPSGESDWLQVEWKNDLLKESPEGIPSMSSFKEFP